MVATLILVVRLSVGTLLLIALVGKVLDLRGAIKQLSAYRLLPARTSKTALAILLATELTLGTLLIMGYRESLTMVLTGLTFASFAAVMYVTLKRGLVVECGCMGRLSSSQVSWPLILRNVVIAVALIALPMAGQTLRAELFSVKAYDAAALLLPIIASGIFARRLHKVPQPILPT
ncbi:MauE/DoxX family redox-associated membrane protein [Ornithinimicrobium avium]|nr:MauE/DoxX family redox-associated membrane protein [Ornithinimicrobium avium]